MQINFEIKERYLKNGSLLQKIADIKNVHFGTVYRWFQNDSEALLDVRVLDFIKKETGLTEKEILTEQVAA